MFVNEGQALLWRVRGSLDDIGRAVGVSPQTVHNWRTGATVPTEQARVRIDEMYAIPTRAWALHPDRHKPEAPPPVAVEKGEPAEPAPAPLAPVGPPPDTLSGCLALHARIQLAAAAPGLSSAERAKLSDTEAKVLALRHRLEREGQMLEARIIREHPRWQAVQRAIASAIGACPRCTKLVIDALTRLDV